MFESLMSSITSTFADIWPHEFCIECFLQGFGEGIVGGLLTVAGLALIAAASPLAAVVVAVGLAVYGVATLAEHWHQMDDRQKSEAIGGMFGGLVVGGATSGGMSMPMPAMMATETGEVMVVMSEVTVAAVPGQAAAATATGGSVAMMAGGGGGGGGGDDRPPRKSQAPEEDAQPKPEEGERKYQSSPKHEEGGWGTKMDLPPEKAQEVLDKGVKAPKGKQIYGYHEGKIYEYQPDNAGTYHGYPVPGNEVPPQVLRQMKNDGTITNAEYGKFIKGKK